MWCPKTNRDGSRNAFYEMMLRAEPGDIVFSFRGRMITHIGVVIAEAYEAAKPAAFGSSGDGWLDIGWMVLVTYEKARASFMPSLHMTELSPLLPKKYSPLQASGNGKQFYFTTLTEN